MKCNGCLQKGRYRDVSEVTKLITCLTCNINFVLIIQSVTPVHEELQY